MDRQLASGPIMNDLDLCIHSEFLKRRDRLRSQSNLNEYGYAQVGTFAVAKNIEISNIRQLSPETEI